MGTANRLAWAALTLLAAIAIAVTAEAPAAGPPPPTPPAGCVPPTAGRVALWRGEGTAEDSAGAHDGTLQGDAGFGTGIVGQAFALAGDADHATFPDNGDLDVAGDVTLDGWVRIDDESFGVAGDPHGIGGDRLIFYKVDPTDRYVTYALFIEGDGTTAQAAPLRYLSGDRTLPGLSAGSSPLAWAKDTWYHVAVVRSGDVVTFYRDGVQAGSGTIGQPAASTPTAPVVLGGAPIGEELYNPLKGSIDEAAVWNRALSGDEVRAINDTVTGACRVIPPPPLEPPRNTQRPSIVQARDCSTTLGAGGGCTTLPNTYRCSPGTWEGHDPARPYEFAWQQYVRPTQTSLGGYRTVASGEIFHASSPTRLGLAESQWTYRCTVTAANAAGVTTAASDPKLLTPAYEPPLGPTNPTVDVRVTGIEMTQGIQRAGCGGCVGVLPSRDQTALSQPATVNYAGLTLAAGKYAVARVFADYRRGTGVTGPLRGVTARLEVLDSEGNRLSTLTPQWSPESISPAPADGLAYVSHTQHDDSRISFNFLIPWQQTEHRALSLRAVVNPAESGLAPIKQCLGCNGNSFTLRGIPFQRTEQIRVRPVRIRSNAIATAETVQDMFATAQELMPGYVQYFPYASSVLPVPADPAKAVAAVAQWAADSRLATTDMPIGIFKRQLDAQNKPINGLSGLTVYVNPTVEGRLALGTRRAAIAGDDRPITSVAHELGHLLDLPHADTDCSTGDQLGTADPPSNTTGAILGLGLDRRASSALPRAFSGAQYYDLMSYCGNTDDLANPNTWMGVSNWNRLLARNAPQEVLPRIARGARASAARAAAATKRPLRVIATVDATGAASIFSIAPGQDARVAPDDASPYRIELRDATGQVVSSVAPAVQAIGGERGAPGGELLTATLDFAPSARELVVRRGAEVLARRARSAHAPRASIVAPRAGTGIGRGAATTVRWRAQDADADRLTATIDYSRDGGRTWTVVASDVRGRSTRVDRRALGASGNARIRVRVSDGFDAAIAVSGRLRSPGAPPLVRIDSRPRGVRADQLVLLEGSAFDDAGRPLTGTRLRWFADRRALGSGTRVSVQGLRAGTRTIRLVATDARGRSAVARLRVSVAAVRPQFLLFDAPERVARGARSTRIRVASTVAATLRIGGRSYAVGRAPRRLRVALPRGSGVLRLAVTLTAGAKATRGTYRLRTDTGLNGP